MLAAEAVKTMLDKERAKQEKQETEKKSSGGFGGLGAQASMAAVLVSELAGVSLGLLSTVGVSLGLGAATIMSRGTLAQKERWLPELMTLEKIAAWAITEPDAGSDAFGGMKTYVQTSALRRTTSSTDRRRSSPTAPSPTSWSFTPNSTTANPTGAPGRC